MTRHASSSTRDYFGMERGDYLHVIWQLEASFGEAKISDIARILHVKKPSVSQMAERLRRDTYILYRPYAGIRLTPKGKRAAQEIRERHEALVAFFTALGIPKKTQERDIHGIEHYLSPLTLKKLQAITRKLSGRGRTDRDSTWK